MGGTYAVSWSGGKDGCFALYEARRSGLTISHLVNFVNTEPERVRLHAQDPGLIPLQAEALGIQLIQPETTWKDYEQTFKRIISKLKDEGVKGVVFGDIYLQEHLDWVNRVCGEIGVEAVEPLWKKPTEELFLAFLGAGFEAVIVSAKSELIGKEWLGHTLDMTFAEYMRQRNIDFCGEEGEFHTIVTGGPLFIKRLILKTGGVRSRDGHWLLDIDALSLA